MKRPGLTQPFTWEGCVVKIADKIAYLGRDLEDARTYHVIDMASYRQLREIVGSTLGFERKGARALRSGKAVNTTVLINDLIVDLCEQSSPEKGLCFSDEYFRFILELKKFNFSQIYTHWRLKEFGIYAENTSDEETKRLHQIVVEIIKNYPNVLQMHGFYLDKDKKILNYDLVISFDEKEPNKLIEEIKNKNKEIIKDYQIIINYDQDFSLS